MPRPSVFISVANRVHEQLRSDLRGLLAASYDVIVEPDFTAMSGDSIQQLDQLVKPCQLLVHVIGQDLGSVASKKDAARFLADGRTKDFLAGFPDLRIKTIEQIYELTYPQWEVLFAISNKVPTLVFVEAGLQNTTSHDWWLETLQLGNIWPHHLDHNLVSAQIVMGVNNQFTGTRNASVKLNHSDKTTGTIRAADNIGVIESPLHIPKLFGAITDLDKRRFLKEAFSTIVQVFESGCQQLKARHPSIEFEFDRPDAEKLRCTIYLNGKRRCQCQLWVESDRFGGIHFFNGQSMGNEFNGRNETLNTFESSGELLLKGSFGSGFGDAIDPCHPNEAGASLWRRFVRELENKW